MSMGNVGFMLCRVNFEMFNQFNISKFTLHNMNPTLPMDICRNVKIKCFILTPFQDVSICPPKKKWTAVSTARRRWKDGRSAFRGSLDHGNRRWKDGRRALRGYLDPGNRRWTPIGGIPCP